MQISLQWQNIFSYELQRKDHIECYKRVNDLYPNYPKICWYNLVLRYKAKGMNVFEIKVKLLSSIKYLVFILTLLFTKK